MINRPTVAEIKAMRNIYAAPSKQVAKVFKVYDCGQLVYTGPVGLCWAFIHQWNLKTKPTLK